MMMSTLIDSMSMEQIDHQYDYKFLDELSDAFNDIRASKHKFVGAGGNDDSRDKDQEVIKASGLAKLVKDRFGIILDLTIDPWSCAHIYIPEIDKNNPVISEWQKEFISSAPLRKKLKDLDRRFIASVDLKNARVDGDVVGMPAEIWLGTDLVMRDIFTTEEVAAIFLHEIGHYVTYIMYLGKTAQYGVLLTHALEAFADNKPREQRVEILKLVKDHTKIDDFEVEKLADEKNGVAVMTAIVSSQIRKTPSLSGTEGYDHRTFEALSDQFATRMGAGSALVTGLGKLMSIRPKSEREEPKTILSYIGAILLFIFRVIFISYLAIVSTVALPLLILIFMLFNPDEIYDPPKKRFEKVRRDIINAMKHERNQQRKRMLNSQLEDINKFIEVAHNDTIPVMHTIEKLCGRRKYYSVADAMTELQALQDNDLHARINKLETM